MYFTEKRPKTLEVRALPTDKCKGFLTLGQITVPCALGRSGISMRKLEGDGATPAGRFRLLYGYCRKDRLRWLSSRLPFKSLTPSDGWCDDPTSSLYNRSVSLPFEGSHEKMWRDDCLYDVVIVLDFNIAPATKGQGSAIFFHIARDDFRPTEGCVAISKKDMRRLLPLIDSQTVMRVHF